MSLSFHAAHTPHLFTVDVEDYFQEQCFERAVPRGTWDNYADRVAGDVDMILEMLATAGATGTFFMLGWTAERQPALVRRIVRAGHEVASFGATHRRVCEMSPDEFRDEIRTSKKILEDATGTLVRGFRVPGCSIRENGDWAFDVLLEEGYEYDSSTVPAPRAGDSPAIPWYVHAVRGAAGTLLEVPLTTVSMLGWRRSAMGGASLRHLPYSATRKAMHARQAAGIPAVFQMRAWELDVEQPRLAGPVIARLSHYGGLKRTRPRLAHLLREFRFTSVADALSQLEPTAPVVHVA